MPSPPLGVEVETSGFFFRGNPVGRLHLNMYGVLRDLGQIGVEAAQSRLFPEHGYVTGNLHDSIRARPERMTRGMNPVGRLVIIQGMKGYELVRRYGRKVEAKYHHIRDASRDVQQYVDSHAGPLSDQITRGLDDR